MAFWNEFPNRKDWRKTSRKHSSGCQNHGDCDYCLSDRIHKYQKRKESANINEQLLEMDYER